MLYAETNDVCKKKAAFVLDENAALRAQSKCWESKVLAGSAEDQYCAWKL